MENEKLPMNAERQTATPKGHKKRLRVSFLMMATLASVLLVAGCGNDDDVPPVEDPAPPQTEPAPMQEETVPPQEVDRMSPQEEAERSQEPMNDEMYDEMGNPEDDEQMYEDDEQR